MVIFWNLRVPIKGKNPDSLAETVVPGDISPSSPTRARAVGCSSCRRLIYIDE
jgi:hypothetical protein